MSAGLDWLPPAIRARSMLRRLEAGEMLFRRGDKSVGIFEIEQGRLRMIRYTIEDHAAVLASAGRGELFAEASLFAETYHCDAVAAIASEVRIYPKEVLLAALRADAALAERFMALLARELMALRARLEARNIRSARQRILHHLAGSGGRMAVPGTLMEFAADLGLAHEVLYRTLAALEADGLIERDAQSISLRARSPI
jgi:CRP-like cAMP-binding protein